MLEPSTGGWVGSGTGRSLVPDPPGGAHPSSPAPPRLRGAEAAWAQRRCSGDGPVPVHRLRPEPLRRDPSMVGFGMYSEHVPRASRPNSTWFFVGSMWTFLLGRAMFGRAEGHASSAVGLRVVDRVVHRVTRQWSWDQIARSFLKGAARHL